jgi:hypothetical protein
MAFNHQTLHDDIRGFIDERTTTGEITKIVGWCFYLPTFSLHPLRVLENQTTVVEVTKIERLDVSNAYRVQSVIKSGFSFEVKSASISELQMKIGAAWITVFMFVQETAAQEEGRPKSTIRFADSTTHKNGVDLPLPVTVTVGGLLSATRGSDVGNFGITKQIPTLVVVDNFYENPMAIREFALKCEFKPDLRYHKGSRSEPHRFEGLKERFEGLLGRKITNWEKGPNGVFQTCVAGDQLVYHDDFQQYAGVLYLTPDAPPQTGTCLYRSKYTKKMKVPKDEFSQVFKNGFLDSTEFDLVDVVGNVFNRVVLFDSHCIHSAQNYFGTTKENGRLFQLFFFDLV